MTVCIPTARELTVREALPFESRDVVPSVVDPSRSVTVPDGTPPLPEAVTTAVNINGCPKTLGFCEVERAVAVLLWLTTWETPAAPDAEEGLKFPSPV